MSFCCLQIMSAMKKSLVYFLAKMIMHESALPMAIMADIIFLSKFESQDRREILAIFLYLYLPNLPSQARQKSSPHSGLA